MDILYCKNDGTRNKTFAQCFETQLKVAKMFQGSAPVNRVSSFHHPESCLACGHGWSARKKLHKPNPFTGLKPKEKEKYVTVSQKSVCSYPGCSAFVSGYSLCRCHSLQRARGTFFKTDIGNLDKKDFLELWARYQKAFEASGCETMEAFNTALIDEGLIQFEKRMKGKNAKI